MNPIVTKDVLDLYDKYDGDLGLLDEPWADKKDRLKISIEQSTLLSEYIDKLHLIKLGSISGEMREAALKRIREIECLIDPAVIDTLRMRFSYT